MRKILFSMCTIMCMFFCVGCNKNTTEDKNQSENNQSINCEEFKDLDNNTKCDDCGRLQTEHVKEDEKTDDSQEENWTPYL